MLESSSVVLRVVVLFMVGFFFSFVISSTIVSSVAAFSETNYLKIALDLSVNT